MYGRRRCGKSTLLQRVLEPQQFYFQADQRETPLQLESLAAELSRRLTDFDKVRYRTWDELLASLYARADRLLHVCVDEFPYLVQADPALPSILQRYIDRQAGRVAWILCGSSQRMMQGMVMDRSAPLYGRAREVLKIEPLSAGWVMHALALDATAAVRAYATWGGVPRYWELASEYGDQDEALEDLVWNPRGVLHEEPGRLLLDDLRSAVQPYSILSLIGSGAIVPRRSRPGWPSPFPAWRGPWHSSVSSGTSAATCRSVRTLRRLGAPCIASTTRFCASTSDSCCHTSHHSHRALRVKPSMIGSGTARASSGHAGRRLCRASVPWIPGFDPPYGAASAWSPTGGQQADVDVVALSLDRKSLLLGECKWSDRKRRFDLDAIDRQLREKGAGIPAARGKRIVTSCWLGGTAQTTGRIDRLLTPDDVMAALTR